MELMEGLTVLSTGTTHGMGVTIVLIALGVLALLCGIALLVLAVVAFRDRSGGAGAFCLVYALAVILAGVVALVGASEPAKTTYKVTIDENVSAVEFNERYEIIDQDGLIYEIVEKGE